MTTEQSDQKARPAPAADVLAQLLGVYKRFGQIEALRGVDLAIHQGEVVALLGPNGAGKTTTISIRLGVRRPERGEAWLCSMPLALLGIALGYWARPTAAAPVANLLYLVLAYAGGLWTPPRHLPDLVAQISPYLPTRRYADVVWAPVLGQAWRVEDWLWLLGYKAAFGFLAIWGYQRDEGERFR